MGCGGGCLLSQHSGDKVRAIEVILGYLRLGLKKKPKNPNKPNQNNHHKNKDRKRSVLTTQAWDLHTIRGARVK